MNHLHIVISAGRPEAVEHMHKKVGVCTWVVPEHEMTAYALMGANSIIPDAGGNVAAARNVALEQAYRQLRTCVMWDDDVGDCVLVGPGGRITKVHPLQLVERMDQLLTVTGYRLAAPNVHNNASWVTQEYSRRTTINGGCLVIRETPLRFDEQLLVSEDVDYALQHGQRYGGWIRLDAALMNFKHRQPGGVQLYRSEPVEAAAAAYLLRKWPGHLHRNPRAENPNHLAMRWPKREVLS